MRKKVRRRSVSHWKRANKSEQVQTFHGVKERRPPPERRADGQQRTDTPWPRPPRTILFLAHSHEAKPGLPLRRIPAAHLPIGAHLAAPSTFHRTERGQERRGPGRARTTAAQRPAVQSLQQTRPGTPRRGCSSPQPTRREHVLAHTRGEECRPHVRAVLLLLICLLSGIQGRTIEWGTKPTSARQTPR